MNTTESAPALRWVPLASNTDAEGCVYTDASQDGQGYRFRFVPLADGGFRVNDPFSVVYSDERFAPCHAPSWWLNAWPKHSQAEWIVGNRS